MALEGLLDSVLFEFFSFFNFGFVDSVRKILISKMYYALRQFRPSC